MGKLNSNMAGEIWVYYSPKPNDNKFNGRPVLVIGDDSTNGLKFVDISYVIISSSSETGKYDIEISEEQAIKIGLERKSVIKTTKIYTGSKSYLKSKIGDLPKKLKKEFVENYKTYQKNIILNLEEIDLEEYE